jgi:phospholipid transport system substrate-binding protein
MLNVFSLMPSTPAFSPRRRTGLTAACLVAAAAFLPAAALAQKPVDAKGSPSEFVQTVADNVLEVIKRDHAVKSGDLARINAIVNEYVLPYVNLEKTTRLAAGRYWRQASPKQQQDLVQAFKGTLIRTYSGAFTRVTPQSSLSLLPFHGDAKAKDVVVRSTLSQGNGPSVGIDYRLENTAQGWKVYDLNVEGIWLIQNYRNQFAQQISQNGVDGLIAALNQNNR